MFNRKIKYAFGYPEIIVGIIFIGLSSLLLMQTANTNKTRADINVNLNTHILLDSEIEQNKGRCKMLKTNTCTSLGGIVTGNNLMQVGDVCNFTYIEKGISGRNYNITNMCKKESDQLFSLQTTLSGYGIVRDGEGYVVVQ